MTCDPGTLIQQAACFECLDDKTLTGLKTYLICQWANAGGGPPPGPSTPTNLLISNSTTNGNIILNWTAGGPAPTTYEIWVSINGGAYALLNTVGGGVTTYTDTNAMGASDQWYYKVRACDGATCSAFTDPAGIFNGFTHTVNTGLTNYTFPFLQFVIGDFDVRNQAAMTSISVPMLRKCTGNFVVNSMPVITTLTTTSLQTCVLLATNTNTVLPSLSFPALLSVSGGGGFFFGDCPALQFLSAPSLTSVTGDFDGRNNGAMSSIAVPLLATVSGDIFCRFASSLSSVDFSNLTSVANINFEFSGAFDLSLPSLTTVSAGIMIASSGITSFTANAMTTIGNDLSSGSSAIMSFSANALTSIGGAVNFDGCGFLTTLSMNSLVSVGGNFDYTDLGVLSTFTLPALTSIGGKIQGNNCGATTIVLNALQTIGGGGPGGFYDSLNCPNLTIISLNALTDVGALGTDFGSSPNLVTVSWPNVIFTEGTVVGIDNCALNAATVNQTLARGVASGTTTADYELSNGTSAAPTGQGIIDKATLITAGNTVNTN